jgi:hypothetical protein
MRRGVVSASTAVVSDGRFLAHANAQSEGTDGAPVAQKPASTWGDRKCVHLIQKRSKFGPFFLILRLNYADYPLIRGDRARTIAIHSATTIVGSL